MSDAYDESDPKHPGFVDRLQERLDERNPAPAAARRSVEQWLITAPQGTFEAILSVTVERSRQEDKGWTPEHDDAMGWEHAAREAWARLPEAAMGVVDEPRVVLVKCAALLVAAIEAIDRG